MNPDGLFTSEIINRLFSNEFAHFTETNIHSYSSCQKLHALRYFAHSMFMEKDVRRSEKCRDAFNGIAEKLYLLDFSPPSSKGSSLW